MKNILLILTTVCVMASLSVHASSFKVLNIDPNGGTNTMIAHNLVYDIGASFIVTNPTRAGYTFAGWTGSGVNYLSKRGFTGSTATEVSFNGTSDYYNLGRTYMYTDRITVNLWAYMANWSEYNSVGMRMISCTQTGGWCIEPTADGNIRFQCYDSGVGYKSAIASELWSSLAAGWHMFTLTFDGTNVRGYIDGVLKCAGKDFESGAIGYHAANSILLGAEAGTGDTPAGSYFKGKIKDVTIAKSALGTKEVADLYSVTKTLCNDNATTVRYYVPTSNAALKASWTANAATTLTINPNGGTNTMSESSYSQSAGTALTVTNPTRPGYTFKGWDATTNKYISNYQGFTCSSTTEVSFNGTSTYYDLGRTYMFTDDITINLWGYMADWSEYASSAMRMISCTQGGGWGIERNGDYIRFGIYDAGANGYKSFTLSKKWADISAGWHMFTMTFDGAQAMGFIDGKLVGRSAVFCGKIGYSSTNSILLGAEVGDGNTPAGSYFKGKLKNVCIMNVAITPEEVSSLYGTPGVARYYFPTSATTLKAFWEGGITPTIVVNPTELTFTSTQGVEASKTLTVSGSNLTNTITLALSGTNAELFSLSATSLPSAGGTVTVKYKPVATGSHMATLSVSSSGAAIQGVSLTGTSTGSGPTVPTLTKIWESTNVLHDTLARYGTGYNGKVYATDASHRILYSWDSEGCQKTSVATGIGGGWACTCDNSGNILTNTGKWGTSFTDWQIYSISNKSTQALAVSAPSGVTSGYIYANVAATGNVLSSTGGSLYLAPAGQKVAARIIVKSGAQDASSSSGPTYSEGTFSNEDAVSPLNVDNLTAETFMWRQRGGNINYISGSTLKTYSQPSNKTTNTGFDAFKLKDVEYGVIPTGTYKADGFSVFTLSDGEVIASRTETKTGSVYYVSIKVEEVSDTKVNIYYYKAGDVAAMYTFEVPSITTNSSVETVSNFIYYTSDNTFYVEGITASEITFYSLTGQKLCSATNSNSLTFGSLKGAYVAKVTDVSGGIYTGKVVIR
ncbi:MAG: InlB B-repeat-containing protein [Paludibacteraceae bacterium]|nr:InlB B-repeat-containing protein [Paludibacteraceae bacterium]